MKKLTIIFLLILFISAPAFAAPTGCTIVSSIVDQYTDGLGEHSIYKIVVTQTSTTFSFTSEDFTASEEKKFWRGFAYWIGIDATGTLDAAPELTVTDQWAFTQFSDTTSFHVSNPIKVLGNSYDGQYLHLTPEQVWSFNDVGAGEIITLYIDIVR